VVMTVAINNAAWMIPRLLLLMEIVEDNIGMGYVQGFDAQGAGAFEVGQVVVEEKGLFSRQVVLVQHLLEDVGVGLALFHDVRIVGAVKELVEGRAVGQHILVDVHQVDVVGIAQQENAVRIFEALQKFQLAHGNAPQHGQPTGVDLFVGGRDAIYGSYKRAEILVVHQAHFIDLKSF